MLTAYPEARRLLDYGGLQLRKFEPGALVWHGGKFHRFADPFRDPGEGPGSLLIPLFPGGQTTGGNLRNWVQRGNWAEIFTRPEKTTRDYLQAVPFSPKIIERFFEPFFGGIFLERELVTSSRFFEFLFRMFSVGDTVVPAAGMEQIPLQLAAKLHGYAGDGRPGEKVTRNAQSFQVELREGRR